MMHKVWWSIEEVPCCFPSIHQISRSHRTKKITDLDQIWARLLGRSQLSNPSDLPCLCGIRCTIPSGARNNLEHFKLRPSSSKNTSFGPSVRLSVCPSVTPFWQCSCYRIILKFSGVTAIDRRHVHAEGQCQRSKLKVTEVKPTLAISGP